MASHERVQVLLRPAQRRALAKIAKREGRSASEVLREMIEWRLARRADGQEQWRDALQWLDQLREGNRARGVYTGDLVAEVRAEREAQLEEIWRGS